MSAVNSTSFANKKPKLEGGVSSAITTNAVYPRNTGDPNTPTGTTVAAGEITIATKDLTAGESVNVGYISWAAYIVITSSGTGVLRIRKDSLVGDILATGGSSATSNFSIATTITNQDVGTTTYFITWQPTEAYVIRSGQSASADGIVFQGFLVDAVDTHSTKNPNIIRG